MSTAVEIPMDATATPPPPPTGDAFEDDMAPPPPQGHARPLHVLISPIVPAAPADGAIAALPQQAYTGVLYLPHHKLPAADHDAPKKRLRERWLKEMRGWLMVLAVLAASVTYQAGLNPPGGFWQQDDAAGYVAGTPVLESKFPKRYTVFFYFNSTAFVTSVVIIVLLMNESFYHSEAKVEALEIIVVLDMAALMGAYIAGCTRRVSSSLYVIVLAVVVLLYAVYTAQFLPKLWGLVLHVPCVHTAARRGALPVPQDVLDRHPHLPAAHSAPEILDAARPRPDMDRTKSAPPLSLGLVAGADHR